MATSKRYSLHITEDQKVERELTATELQDYEQDLIEHIYVNRTCPTVNGESDLDSDEDRIRRREERRKNRNREKLAQLKRQHIISPVDARSRGNARNDIGKRETRPATVGCSTQRKSGDKVRKGKEGKPRPPSDASVRLRKNLEEFYGQGQQGLKNRKMWDIKLARAFRRYAKDNAHDKQIADERARTRGLPLDQPWPFALSQQRAFHADGDDSTLSSHSHAWSDANSSYVTRGSDVASFVQRYEPPRHGDDDLVSIAASEPDAPFDANDPFQRRYADIFPRRRPRRDNAPRGGQHTSESDEQALSVPERGLGVADGVNPATLLEMENYASDKVYRPRALKTQLRGLRRLYKLTAGKNWTHQRNWLTQAPMNQWHGLVFFPCNSLSFKYEDDRGLVREICLRNNNLVGKLPVTAVESLKSLEVLDLGCNRLEGEIDDSMFRHLKRLKVLSLDGNRLTGLLPLPAFNALENLEELFLSRNCLTGRLPIALATMTKVRHVV
jgi:hypothetical protein